MYIATSLVCTPYNYIQLHSIGTPLAGGAQTLLQYLIRPRKSAPACVCDCIEESGMSIINNK